MKSIASTMITVLLICFCSTIYADDREDLTSLLKNFLANAGKAEAHQRFWAEELVYTSSRGTRTNKAEIMESFNNAVEQENSEPEPVYSAEEIQIQIYGDTAIIAFQLVQTPPADSGDADAKPEIINYYNTGTFLKRDRQWQVIAWQATRIPKP